MSLFRMVHLFFFLSLYLSIYIYIYISWNLRPINMSSQSFNDNKFNRYLLLSISFSISFSLFLFHSIFSLFLFLSFFFLPFLYRYLSFLLRSLSLFSILNLSHYLVLHSSNYPFFLSLFYIMSHSLSLSSLLISFL